MADSQLELDKESLLASKLSSRSRSFKSHSDFLWEEALSRTYLWEREQRECQLISRVTRQELVDFFGCHLAPGRDSVRCKISLQSYKRQLDEDSFADTLEDLADFQVSFSQVLSVGSDWMT